MLLNIALSIQDAEEGHLSLIEHLADCVICLTHSLCVVADTRGVSTE